MGLNYTLTEEEAKACREAYNKREQRGIELERRIKRIKGFGRSQAGEATMNEWARQMLETFMYRQGADEGVASRYLTNEESWKEMKRILETMTEQMRARQSITEATPSGQRILQSRFTAHTILGACRQSFYWHTIEFEERVKKIQHGGALLLEWQLMFDWAQEMKHTFIPSGIATEYLKNEECWKEIKRFFDEMERQIVRRIAISAPIGDGRQSILSRFTAQALLESIQTFHPPPAPSSDDTLPSNLLASAHPRPPASHVVTRVPNDGRVQRPRPSSANTGSNFSPFQVGRRGSRQASSVEDSDEEWANRPRPRLWIRGGRDGSERADQ